MLVAADDPHDLTEMLQPYMDLMSWDVRAITENDYSATVERMRQVAQQAS
jgi:hypothetical protein